MKNKNYGLLIADADKNDRAVFVKFLGSNMHAVNFEKDKEKDLGDYSMQLKTAENLNIIAIGHGYSEDKFINEKGKEHSAVTVIGDVKPKSVIRITTLSLLSQGSIDSALRFRSVSVGKIRCRCGSRSESIEPWLSARSRQF